MEKKGSKFDQYRIIYNQTLKQTLNLPKNTNANKIDKLLGVQSAKNIVQASYVRNYQLWEREFKQEDMKNDKQAETKEFIEDMNDDICEEVKHPC